MNNFQTEWDKMEARHKKTKKIFIWIFVVAVTVIAGFYVSAGYMVVSEIQDNNGTKNTIIKYGKEIKDIMEKIEEKE